MSFHVLVHPNRGQPVPKWWACGANGVDEVICWGKLGQMSSKVDNKRAGPSKRFEKKSEGYLDLGSFNFASMKILDAAIKQVRSIWAGTTVIPASPEEKKLLEAFCREFGRSLSLIAGQQAFTAPPPGSTPTPEKAQKGKSPKKTRIADLSGSWF